MFRLFRKSKLSYEERMLLKIIPKQYTYLARNANGLLVAFLSKPKKIENSYWADHNVAYDRNLKMFNHLFSFITINDEAAYSIKDLMKM